MHPFSALKFYAVQNAEGKWFRRKGYGGYGDTWTDSPTAARIYNKIGPARGTISFFAEHYPKYGTPNLVEISLGEIKVHDDAAYRAKKARKK